MNNKIITVEEKAKQTILDEKLEQWRKEIIASIDKQLDEIHEDIKRVASHRGNYPASYENSLLESYQERYQKLIELKPKVSDEQEFKKLNYEEITYSTWSNDL